MRKILATTGASATALALSATVALAGGGVSGVAKGHGEAVADVAKAAETVGSRAHGDAVSAIAKQHGAEVSAAAKALGEANAAAGKTKGAAKAAEGQARGDDAREESRLKNPTDD